MKQSLKSKPHSIWGCLQWTYTRVIDQQSIMEAEASGALNSHLTCCLLMDGGGGAIIAFSCIC